MKIVPSSVPATKPRFWLNRLRSGHNWLGYNRYDVTAHACQIQPDVHETREPSNTISPGNTYGGRRTGSAPSDDLPKNIIQLVAKLWAEVGQSTSYSSDTRWISQATCSGKGKAARLYRRVRHRCTFNSFGKIALVARTRWCQAQIEGSSRVLAGLESKRRAR